MPSRPVRETIGDHEAISHALVDFVDGYQEASALKRAEIAHKAEQPRKPYKPPKAKPQIDADIAAAIIAVDYAALAREERQSVAERLRIGFKWENERTFGSDYFLPAFVEYGLRSWNDPVDKMFVAAAPKARKLQCGPRKDSAFIRRRKIQALDQPYVRFNQLVRFGWRIDLDGIFDGGVEDLLKQFRIATGGFEPHKVVGHLNADGHLIRPHVWILLQPGNALWYDRSDARCNVGAMWLYDNVGLGIVDRLKGLGADPAAMGDPLRGKNPLSPLWSAWTVNSADFRTLSEYAALFGVGRGRDVQIREAAEEKSGLGKQGSNSLFTELRREAWDTLKDMAAGSDPEYLACLADRALLGDLLELRLGRISRAAFDCKPGQVMAVLRRVVSYAASEWDPRRAEEKKRIRGALYGQLKPHMTLHERQSAGGKYAGELRVTRSVEVIGQAIFDAREAGEEVTKSLISRRSGASRTTVIAHWEDALRFASTCTARCIVKKQTLSRPDQSTDLLRAQTAEIVLLPLATAENTAPETPSPERKTYHRPAFLTAKSSAQENNGNVGGLVTFITHDNHVQEDQGNERHAPDGSTVIAVYRRPAFLSRKAG